MQAPVFNPYPQPNVEKQEPFSQEADRAKVTLEESISTDVKPSAAELVQNPNPTLPDTYPEVIREKMDTQEYDPSVTPKEEPPTLPDTYPEVKVREKMDTQEYDPSVTPKEESVMDESRTQLIRIQTSVPFSLSDISKNSAHALPLTYRVLIKY
ncbi:unnamed protein product [Strongylus vulgaris]|uniref:Uncharacterized protein n=1 Tax=Strongylus vulgaris TaxID=40348 RepID=A0A3P7LUP1_STRVU|nr:unnamed protein product [Strongylus vulgaris]